MRAASVILISMATSIVTAAGTVAVLDVIGLPHEREKPKVPKVVGLSEKDARTNLQAAGYSLMVAGRRPAADAEPGMVIEQSPAAGSPLDEGQAVNVTFAEAVPTVPNVVGKSLAEAKAALANAGYETTVGPAKPSKDGGTGMVLEQTPAPATDLKKGSIVTLVPSAGPELVEVPKVRGLGYGNAKKIIDEAGLEFAITFTEVGDVSNDVVVRQEPEEGESVEPGSKVTVIVKREEEVDYSVLP